MKANRMLLFFVKNFSTGLILPVLTLLILSRGATLGTLAWIIGCYSAATILMEFPSGVFCDLFGRKRTFLLSEGLVLVSYLLLLFTNHTVGLVAAMLIQGMGRAFSSGSLDALTIEDALDTGGEQMLAKVNGQLSILESMGIAIGCILSGVLAKLMMNYQLNLILSGACHVLILFLTLSTVHEHFVRETHRKECSSFTMWTDRFLLQMKQSLQFVLHEKPVRRIIFLMFLCGIGLFSVETYWQSRFAGIAHNSLEWMLGLISFAGFCFTSLGSFFCQKFMTKVENRRIWQWMMYLFHGCFFLAFLVLAISGSLTGFAVTYCLVYFALGCVSVAQSTILSHHIVNENRASIMSFASLLFQFGGLSSAFLTGLVMPYLTIPLLWTIAGLSLTGILMVFIIIVRTSSETAE